MSPAKKKQFYINQAIRNSELIPRAKGKKSLRRQENRKFSFCLIWLSNSLKACSYGGLHATCVIDEIRNVDPKAKTQLLCYLLNLNIS